MKKMHSPEYTQDKSSQKDLLAMLPIHKLSLLLIPACQLTSHKLTLLLIPACQIPSSSSVAPKNAKIPPPTILQQMQIDISNKGRFIKFLLLKTKKLSVTQVLKI
jgi:hypothetical protein